MSTIKAFRGIRPRKDLVSRIAALPYDVYNREEAKAEVEKEPLSFLKIDRPETQFPDTMNMYASCVYEKAKETLRAMIEDHSFQKEEEDAYYIYELTRNGKVQTGIVACASIDDYLENRIKKHENTREEKEIDRITHVDQCSAQTGPIFLAYRAKQEIDEIVERVKKETPEYDFTSVDGVTHRVWVMNGKKDMERIYHEFQTMDSIYIADGHHRAASAVKVGMKRRKENPDYTGKEEFNYFLSVLFPDNQLMIMDYNRVVKDLNGLTEKEFLKILEDKFQIEKKEGAYKPEEKGKMGMYLSKNWYELTAKPEIRKNHPVDGLDAAILQNEVLAPILEIKDPKTDKRIDFVGGIRGLGELEKRCAEDMALAFSLYPTSIEELFQVADAELLMPPKSTWFEPKLRSGIFIHEI
ncbi:MAG: DUF1015 domain-containing protein [Acetivibrio sp.]